MSLSFEGRVVVITGAGAGIGKNYALDFAERGASVVVNDLGGSTSGEGKSVQAADLVVKEIQQKGGKAVADYNNVENGDRIIQTAIDKFGRIDVLINNAGILRDRSIARTSDLDWDLIHRVHLRGVFVTTRAAWTHMVKQKYGKIIFTSSMAGILGNYGQSNYGSAKMGVIGLNNVLAREGERYNISCNVIVPMAGSRLMNGILPPDMLKTFSPSHISPVVLWMTHEDCRGTGLIIEAAGGYVARLQMHRSNGAVFTHQPGDKITVEAIRDKWNSVTDMTNFNVPESGEESVGFILERLESGGKSVVTEPNSSGKSKINVPLALSYKFPNEKFSYTTRDAILYALSVGVSLSDEGSLKYLYEGRDDFTVFPLFGVITSLNIGSKLLTSDIPGTEIDLSRLFHGEQYFEVYKPLPPSGELEARARLVDILDKGSGALYVLNVDCYTSDAEKFAMGQITFFVVGQGNFGGKRNSEHTIPEENPPERKPDMVVTHKTSIDQAVLYRLSGDVNPMHIDPEFSAMSGFERPILHGLCTYGIVMKQVMQNYAGGDVMKIKAMKARFAKPVLPGQSLQTEMWKEGNKVYFRTKTLETGKPILTGGYIVLSDSPSTQPSLPAATTHTASSLPGLQSDALFMEMKNQLSADPKLAAGTQAIILFNIMREGKMAAQWTVDLRDGQTDVQATPPDVKPDVTISADDAVMMEIASGQLPPNKAFGQGKLKVKGKLALMRKLQGLLQKRAKL